MRFKDRFRRAMAHAFATGPTAAPLSPQDLQLLQTVADAIVRRRLETRVGLVFATEVDSLGRSYSFTLASRQGSFDSS